MCSGCLQVREIIEQQLNSKFQIVFLFKTSTGGLFEMKVRINSIVMLSKMCITLLFPHYLALGSTAS